MILLDGKLKLGYASGRFYVPNMGSIFRAYLH